MWLTLLSGEVDEIFRHLQVWRARAGVWSRATPSLEGDVTHEVHPLLGGALLGGEHVRLVVGLHAEGGHVVFGAVLCEGGQDGDALGQADDLLVQFPSLLTGAGESGGPGAAPRGRVEKLQPRNTVRTGWIQHEPVLLPFLPELLMLHVELSLSDVGVHLTETEAAEVLEKLF